MGGMGQAHVDDLFGAKCAIRPVVGGKLLELLRREVEHLQFTAQQYHRVDWYGNSARAYPPKTAKSHHDRLLSAAGMDHLIDVTENPPALNGLKHGAMQQIPDPHRLGKPLCRECRGIDARRRGLLREGPRRA